MFVCSLLVFPKAANPQGETTSAIAGEVTDPSGAAIPGADISAVKAANGLRRGARTDAAGRFLFPQLSPGTYTVRAAVTGFVPQQIDAVLAALGRTATANFVLKVQAERQVITVVESAHLINTENPNTSTVLGAPALESLPNSGSDLTYPLQFAAGALVNTAGRETEDQP